MKKIIFVLFLMLSGNSFGSNEEYARYQGGMFYISSYSNAALYSYYSSGQSVSLLKFSGPTTLFCAIAAMSEPSNLLESGFLNNFQHISITASHSDLYMGVCLKASGSSADNLVTFDRGNTKTKRISGQERNLELEDKLLEYIRSTLE